MVAAPCLTGEYTVHSIKVVSVFFGCCVVSYLQTCVVVCQVVYYVPNCITC